MNYAQQNLRFVIIKQSTSVLKSFATNNIYMTEKEDDGS